MSGNCYIIDQCCLKYNAIVAIQVSVSAASFDKVLNPELCLFFLADSPYSETRLISMCVCSFSPLNSFLFQNSTNDRLQLHRQQFIRRFKRPCFKLIAQVSIFFHLAGFNSSQFQCSIVKQVFLGISLDITVSPYLMLAR